MREREPDRPTAPAERREEVVRTSGAYEPTVAPREALVEPRRDWVRWGPIVAGIFFAIATALLMGLLGVALGFSQELWWAALSGIVAFLLGGWVAGRSASASGALNGALVWASVLVFALILAGVGLAGAAALVGPGVLGPGLGDILAGRAAPETRQTAAWGAIASLVIGFLAAALGGWLGERQRAGEEARVVR